MHPTMKKAEAFVLATRIKSDARAAGVHVRTSVERGWRAYSVWVSAIDPATGLWQEGAICGFDAQVGNYCDAAAYDRDEMLRLAAMTVAEREAERRARYEAQEVR